MRSIITKTFSICLLHFVWLGSYAQSVDSIISKYPKEPLDTISLSGNYRFNNFRLKNKFASSVLRIEGETSDSKLNKRNSENKNSTNIFFSNVTIDGGLVIKNKLFDDKSSLRIEGASRFNHVIIHSSNFYSRPIFSFSSFGSFGINYSTFHKGIYFWVCVFDERIILSSSDLTRSQISDTLSFYGSEFKKGGQLKLSVFPEYIDFRHVKIEDFTFSLNSSGPRQNENGRIKPTLINLFDAPLDKIDFSYEYLKLDIPKSIDIATFEKSNRLYEKVLKKFKDNGQLSSYEKLDKEYRAFKFTDDPRDNFIARKIGQSLNFLNRFWNDYGYDKVRIWNYTIFLFVFFTLINWIRLPHLNHKVYPIKAIQDELRTRKGLENFSSNPSQHPWYNFKAFDQAIFYTALIFFGFKMSTENLKFGAKRGAFYIFFQYVVGLICVAYLANFVISSQLIGG